jgi:steroid 5-alpha reductase family enzyme
MRFQTDRRFDGMRENPLAFLVFWILQMLWVWVVSLPVIYVNATTSDASLGWVDYLAFSLAGFALILEIISDHTKLNFK